MKKFNQKTFLKIGIVATALVVAFPAVAATTFNFVPAAKNAKVGEIFTLTLPISSTEKIYTVKSEISFPADLLSVTAFNFSSSWMPLSQSGYDLTDNTNGLLVKSAGYPGGLSSTANFGTITFKAKKAGEARILLTSNSLVLNASNANTLLGASEVRVSISTVQAGNPATTAPVQQQTPVVSQNPASQQTVTPAPSTSSATTEEELEVAEVITETSLTQVQERNSAFLADIGSILASPRIWVFLIGGIIGALGGIFIVNYLKKKRN